MELIILFIIGFIFFLIFFLRDRHHKDSYNKQHRKAYNKSKLSQNNLKICIVCGNEAIPEDDRCVIHATHGFTSVKCSVCGEDVIPGDTVCYYHNN